MSKRTLKRQALSKPELDWIKAIALQQPIVMSATHEKHYMKGNEVLELGTIEEVDGEKIDPEKMYMIPMSVHLAFNHYRRLKKAYLKDDIEGVKNYCDKIKRIADASKN